MSDNVMVTIVTETGAWPVGVMTQAEANRMISCGSVLLDAGGRIRYAVREAEAQAEPSEHLGRRRTGPVEWGPFDINGTSLRGYLMGATWTREGVAWPWSFEETVARLIALSGQDPTLRTDEYKVSVEFVGRLGGDVFTLYDYKGDGAIHVGGASVSARALAEALLPLLRAVDPIPYRARMHYDGVRGQIHGWGR